MKIAVCLLAALTFVAPRAYSQTPNAVSGSQLAERKVEPAKDQAIRKLFALTKVSETMIEGMRTGLDAQKAAQPDVPEAFWEEFIKRATAEIGEFETILVSLYDRHYSREEIDRMIEFYQTPLGRMMAEKQPKIATETIKEAETWGMKLGLKVASDLVDRGLLKP